MFAVGIDFGLSFGEAANDIGSNSMFAVLTNLFAHRTRTKNRFNLLKRNSENISASSSNFWILAHALRDFVSREEKLPVSGVVPDMFSDSERFIKLQNIYKDKANQDAEMIGRKVAQVLESLGRGSDTISDIEVRRFCKEARYLRVLRGSSLSREFRSSNLSQHLEDPESDVLYYIVLRAVDQYMSQFNANPGIEQGDRLFVSKSMSM